MESVCLVVVCGFYGCRCMIIVALGSGFSSFIAVMSGVYCVSGIVFLPGFIGVLSWSIVSACGV